MTSAPAWKFFEERGLRKVGENWLCICPSHKDEKQSLSIAVNDKGVMLLRCFAGCPAVTIVETLGLKMFDLWPPEDSKIGRGEKMQEFNVVKEYLYTDEQGEVLYKVQRGDPKAFRQLRRVDKGWDSKLGDVRRVLYRLPSVIACAKPIMFVEGEKDVESLEALGFIATCCSGGAQGFRPDMAESLKGKRVIIFPDNDPPGIELAWTVKSYVADSIIVKVPLDEPKSDVSDWIAKGATANDIREAVRLRAYSNLCQIYDFCTAVGGHK